MESKLIFCVDDEEDSINALRTGLEARGFAIATARSGPDALNQLRTLLPDLIITDLKMEPMNGFEFYQMARKDPRLNGVPFFFLTAVDDFLARKYSALIGADDYITKPLDLDRIDSAIRLKLNLH